jgi:hypothetical protein
MESLSETNNDYRVYFSVCQIIKAISEYGSPVQSQEKRQNEERIINPSLHQTKQGLLLELYYDNPRSLWTPWGEYDFGLSRTAQWIQILPVLLNRLGAKVFKEKYYQKDEGELGPIYSISQIDGTSLPEPFIRRSENHLASEECLGQWKMLEDRFRQEHFPERD